MVFAPAPPLIAPDKEPVFANTNASLPTPPVREPKLVKLVVPTVPALGPVILKVDPAAGPVSVFAAVPPMKFWMPEKVVPIPVMVEDAKFKATGVVYADSLMVFVAEPPTIAPESVAPALKT